MILPIFSPWSVTSWRLVHQKRMSHSTAPSPSFSLAVQIPAASRRGPSPFLFVDLQQAGGAASSTARRHPAVMGVFRFVRLIGKYRQQMQSALQHQCMSPKVSHNGTSRDPGARDGSPVSGNYLPGVNSTLYARRSRSVQ